MKFIILLVVLFVAGCSDSGYQEHSYNSLPEDLKDCKVYDIWKEDYDGHLTVMRCPKSTTSIKYYSGKYTKTTVTDSE